MQEEVKEQARQGSPSAAWYLQATELIPHPVTKHTPRKLAVILHRLRLGYKATWQLIDEAQQPCNYCDDTPDHPLLHYILECPQTAHLRTNRNIQDPANIAQAASIVRDLIEDAQYHDHLMEAPPPR